jgi:DNA-binding CsgD family transcriptional regulator
MIVTHDDDIETAKILYKEFRVLGRDTVPVVLHWAASSLAWTAGEYLEARDWAEGSVQQLAAGGARLFEVQTAHGYAQNLIKRANQKDLAKARSLIAAGLKTATELGMVRHADAFEAMLTQIGPAPERSNADIWSLTRREFEVLELIDSGLTNRAISETLIISEHTVLRHVSNILSKMSASNRTEAASKARTAGMFQDKVSGNA